MSPSSGRATAVAHPNIALVKYWGKRDAHLNLPAVSSLSLTLGDYATRTTVAWGADRDEVQLAGRPAPEAFAARALRFLDLIEEGRPPCRVWTESNFPVGAGLASSASGFAALAVAALAASGRPRSPEGTSSLARRGSGSACRSVFGGFVVWRRGERADGADSVAEPLAAQDHWSSVRMVVAVTDAGPKGVGSTEGMERSRLTSPFWDPWVAAAEDDVARASEAVLARDLPRLGEVMESSTFKMHATMHTARPPLLYWRPSTVAVLHEVQALRARGIGAWATMDAGPQVKVLCEAREAGAIRDALAPLCQRVDVLSPGGPARQVP